MATAVGVTRVIVGMTRVIVPGMGSAARGSAGSVVAAGVPGVAVVTVVVHAPRA